MMLTQVIGASPWTKIHDAIKPIGFALGFFGLGVWADGMLNGTAKLPWLHQQAAVLQTVQTVTIPKLKAANHCEGARADKATVVAGAAILSANVESVPTPQFRDLPVDNCPHPAGK